MRILAAALLLVSIAPFAPAAEASAPADPLTGKPAAGSIELNWESINLASGYNPDSSDAKLECTSTADGLRITLSATDTGGTSFRMVYVPQAEIEKERAAHAAKEK